MAFTNEQLQEIEKEAAKFMSSRRLPDEIRKELDYGYRIEGQSIFVYEIRPQWNDRTIIRHFDFAKTTYVHTKKAWKVYWMRGDLKWYSYDPRPEVKTIAAFFKLVDEDKWHCFFG